MPMKQHFFEKMELFLTRHSGIIGQQACVQHLNLGTTDKTLHQTLPSFFTPYQSFPDFCLRATYVLSGPLFASLIALKEFATAVYLLFKSFIYNLLFQGWTAFTQVLISAKNCLADGAFWLIYAVLSPLINLIDLLGAGMTMCLGELSNEENTSTLNAQMPESTPPSSETLIIREEPISLESGDLSTALTLRI